MWHELLRTLSISLVGSFGGCWIAIWLCKPRWIRGIAREVAEIRFQVEVLEHKLAVLTGSPLFRRMDVPPPTPTRPVVH